MFKLKVLDEDRLGKQFRQEDRLVDRAAVLRILGIGTTTLYKGIRDGTLPRPVKIGRSARWSEREIYEVVHRLKSSRSG